MAAIKYFIHGKGTEKGLRWEERKDGGGWKRVGEKWRVRGYVLVSVNIWNTYTGERRRDRSVEKRE